MCGNEVCDTVKGCFKEVFKETKEVVEQAEIKVRNQDDHKIPLEFYLSGDYKVFPYYFICYVVFIAYSGNAQC